MILAVDIGNTHIVVGCIDRNNIYFEERLSTNTIKTDLEYAVDFSYMLQLHGIPAERLEGSIISSVVPPVTSVIRSAILKIADIQVLVVGPGLKTGVNILVDDPKEVGGDLIIGAVAGISEYRAPMAIIDMGTATTISVIDAKKNYIGGAIIPGMRIAADTLTAKTAQLPTVNIEPPTRVIGRNTVDCMKGGIFYGNVDLIDGMLDRYERELGTELTCIATGGLSKAVIPYCRHNITLDDGLLLKGLFILYSKNASKS